MNEMAVELATTLDRLLTDVAPIPRLLEATQTARLDTAIVDAVTGLGMGTIALPERDGGLGLDLDDLALVAWAGGRRLLPTVSRLDATLVGPLVGGDRRWASGFPGFGEQPEGSGTVWTVPQATHALVFAEEQAMVVDLVRAHVTDAPGVDPGQGRATIAFDPGAVVAVSVAGVDVIVDRARVAALAELAGIADRVTEVTVEYATQRSQFGRPLTGFQAIQHTLADMRTAAELIRSAVARLVGLSAPDRAMTASLATGVLALAREVVEDAIQVHGGMGFTWEYGLHLYYRRTLAIQEQFGAPTVLRGHVGRELVSRRNG